MALGLLLWVSCICFLLFNGSVGRPAGKGYGYRFKADTRNLGDEQDTVLNSPTFDWQATNNQGTGNKPSVAKLFPTSQSLLSTPSAHEAVKVVKVESRDWKLGNLENPLVFPLKPNKRDPTKPQSSASNSESWQSELMSDAGLLENGVGRQNQNSNTGSNTDGGDSTVNAPLVFEEVFKFPSTTDGLSYPLYNEMPNTVGGYRRVKKLGFSPGTSTQENPSIQTYLSNVRDRPAFPSRRLSPYPSFSPLKLDFSRPGRNIFSWFKQQPFFTTHKVSQRVSEPVIPSYIVQSRNGYWRNRRLFTNSNYSPEFPSPIVVRSKDVKGASPSKPAASKGVKMLESYKEPGKKQMGTSNTINMPLYGVKM